jgi:Thioredoxin
MLPLPSLCVMVSWTILSTFVALTLGIRAAPVESSTESLKQLTQADFSDATAEGLWCAGSTSLFRLKRLTTFFWLARLIEFFSPYCVHCKRFKSTWQQLTLDKASKASFGFKMAQVDCIAQGGRPQGIRFPSPITPYLIYFQTCATSRMSRFTLK